MSYRSRFFEARCGVRAASLGLLLILGSTLGRAVENDCRRVPLAKPLLWPNGLVTLDSGGFVIASPISGSLTAFDGDGIEKWHRLGGGPPPSDFESPASITKIQNGSSRLLIQDGFHRFFFASESGVVSRRLDLGRRSGSRPALSFVPPVFLASGDQIEGLAILSPEDGGPPVAGVFRVATESERWEGPLTTIRMDAPEFLAFTLDARMVAPIAEGVALLVVGASHEVRWVSGGSVRTTPLLVGALDPFPTNLRPGASAMGGVHQELKRLRLPVGIVSDRSILFVMVARPDPDSEGRLWALYEIDPRSGRANRELWLPTRADEIRLAPAAEDWILLEKRVEGVEGTQRASSVVRIPSEWFHSSNSPLARSPRESAVRCRE